MRSTKSFLYVGTIGALLLWTVASAVPVTDGLIVHIRADALNLNDGDPVTVWPDSAVLDGIDGTLLRIGTNNLPVYRTNVLNGMPVVRFTRANSQVMESATWTWEPANGVTAFAVFTGGIGSNVQRVLQVGNTTGANNQILAAAINSVGVAGIRYNNGNALTTAANNPLTTGFQYSAWRMDQGDSYDSAKWYLNNAVPITWDSSTNPGNVINFPISGNSLTVGNGRNSSGGWNTDWYDGDVAEILVYNAVLEESQIQKVLDFLKNKYNKVSAHAPSPQSGAVNQGTLNGQNGVDVSLSWNTGLDAAMTAPNPEITKHYLYLAPGEPNFANVTPVEISAGSPTEATGSYGPIALDLDITCYWRVDESVNDSGPTDANTVMGPVWAFSTLKSVPIISQQPQDTMGEGVGLPASLSVSAISVSPVTYQWYKSTDNANDTPADDLQVGDKSDTLVIDAAQLSDEGYYYCVLTNDGGPTTSAVARLGIKRLVGHWTLDAADLVDGKYQDSSGEGHHAEPNVVPPLSQFVPGVDPLKTAEGLNIAADSTVAADTGMWSPAIYSGEVTVSTWVKWTGSNGAWQGIVSNRTVPAEGNFYVEVRNNNSNVQLNTANATELEGPNLPVDQWVHLAISASQNEWTIYIDGMPVATRSPAAVITDLEVPLYIGALQRNSGVLASPFYGVLDDVRVYNYAKTAVEVADLYYAVTEMPVCLNPEGVGLTFDLNNDCRVNLSDFTMFAGTWLNCGLYPQEECP